MVDNGCIPRRKLIGNGLANAAKPQDSNGLFVHRAGQRGVALGLPIAGADISIIAQKLSVAGQQEQKRRGCNLLVQHIRRMGDKDIAPHCFGDINRIVTDTVPTDDFEIAECAHQLWIHPIMAVCDDMGDRGWIEIVQLMNRECRVKPFLHMWGNASDLEKMVGHSASLSEADVAVCPVKCRAKWS